MVHNHLILQWEQQSDNNRHRHSKMNIVAVLEIGCLQENYVMGVDQEYTYYILKNRLTYCQFLLDKRFLKTNVWNMAKFTV